MTEVQTATTAPEEKLQEVESQLAAALAGPLASLTDAQREILLGRILARKFIGGGSVELDADPEVSVEEAVATVVPLLLAEIEQFEGVELADFTPEELGELIEELLADE